MDDTTKSKKKENSKQTEEKECLLCMEKLYTKNMTPITLECGHSFHVECLSMSIKYAKLADSRNSSHYRECPYCRTKIKNLLPRLPYEMPCKYIHEDYNDFTHNLFSLHDLKGILLNEKKCLGISYTVKDEDGNFMITHKSLQCKKSSKNNELCHLHKKLDPESKVYYFPK